jgi:hypothetical protein
MNQKKRHKITIAKVKEHLRIHTGKPVRILEYRWFEIDDIEVLFVLFDVPYRHEHAPGKRMVRWQVFEEGQAAAGGIAGYRG